MIFTKPTSEVTSVTTTKRHFCSIKEYLSFVRGVSIERTSVNDEKYNHEALSALAQKCANLQINGGDPFIKYVRKCIIEKRCNCFFSLNSLNTEEKNGTLAFANLLCSIGALTNASERKGVLYGEFHFSSARLINFFTGEFLELAIYAKAQRILTEYARSTGADFELLPNVIISSANGRREYDLLARVNSTMYVFEIKSGHMEDFERYNQRGVDLGIDPSCQLIVVSDRTSVEMKLISYFEGVTIANYADFEEKLLQMLTNQ